MDGPKSLSVVDLPIGTLPLDKEALNEMFVLQDKRGNPVPNFPYRISVGDGGIVRATTGKKGEAIRIGSGLSSKSLDIAADIQ